MGVASQGDDGRSVHSAHDRVGDEGTDDLYIEEFVERQGETLDVKPRWRIG